MAFSKLAVLVLLGQENADAPAEPWFLNPMFLIVAIGVMFYFIMIRPEKRKRAELSQMLENLKKNDRVVTVGGICGVIVSAAKGEEYVSIRVDEGSNTKLRVLRSAISRVITEKDEEEKKES